MNRGKLLMRYISIYGVPFLIPSKNFFFTIPIIDSPSDKTIRRAFFLRIEREVTLYLVTTFSWRY